MKKTKVSVTVSRTIQVQQYQPSTVTVTEEAELEAGDKASEAKAELFESASKSVRKFIKAEFAKWED